MTDDPAHTAIATSHYYAQKEYLRVIVSGKLTQGRAQIHYSNNISNNMAKLKTTSTSVYKVASNYSWG